VSEVSHSVSADEHECTDEHCAHNDGVSGQERAPRIERPSRPERLPAQVPYSVTLPPTVRTVRAMHNRRRVIE
jgi:hypothetical protein